jgi:hypothetical protein
LSNISVVVAKVQCTWSSAMARESNHGKVSAWEKIQGFSLFSHLKPCETALVADIKFWPSRHHCRYCFDQVVADLTSSRKQYTVKGRC